ncbi:hypothetical protein RHGRI_032917 [Rhododendron griersonianum]|uniref:Uncharacterized protein n=1 Tax=Rhododendron griersonianum TaxID=479676 RepID=A0AAV6IE90_9ERIC|nr:hypothetical protein RHGRI_032917 [Rhododendron griersonianum]
MSSSFSLSLSDLLSIPSLSLQMSSSSLSLSLTTSMVDNRTTTPSTSPRSFRLTF